MHPLIVHLVVIAVPLSIVLVVVTAVCPAARRRLGLVTPVVAFIALIAVPLATQSGEALERRVDHSTLLEEHARLGDTMVPWAVAVFVVAAAQWAWYRFVQRRVEAPSSRIAITIALSVAVAVAAVGSGVTVVRIGDSGARAVWNSQD
jgi:hypothetical protein